VKTPPGTSPLRKLFADDRMMLSRGHGCLIESDPEEECSPCWTARQARTCSVCGREADLIDCGHYDQPWPITAGWGNGNDLGHDYCEDCSDALQALPELREAAVR
jgi:hypothetical protein